MTARLERRIGKLEESMLPRDCRPDFSAVSLEELRRARAIRDRYGHFDARDTFRWFHEDQAAPLAMGAEIAEQCPTITAAIQKARGYVTVEY